LASFALGVDVGAESGEGGFAAEKKSVSGGVREFFGGEVLGVHYREMSASDDLATYLHLHRSGKPPHNPRSKDTDSVTTSELLSQISSDLSQSDLQPLHPVAYFPPRQGKYQPRLHSGSRPKPTLKPVLEEDDPFSISAFLPDSKPTPKKHFSHIHHSSRLKSHSKKVNSKDFYDQSSVASIDTEALLRSSDEEMEEISLPRQMPKAGSRHLERGKPRKREETRSSPSLKWGKVKLMEEIRAKVREMTKPLRVELKIPANRETDKAYIDGIYGKRRETPEKETPGFSHPSKSTHESLFQPSSGYFPAKSKVSLSLESQKASNVPAPRLELASVCAISILPRFNIHSTGSDFSLLDQFQSPASRKSHLTDSSLTRSLRLSREPPKFASSRLVSRAKLSIVQAVVVIQRAVRRYVLKGNGSNRPGVAIKAYENWSSDHAYRLPPTLKRRLVEPVQGLVDPERATQSLYTALDQLTALKAMASRSSSEETSFVLSESLETTQGQKGRVSARSRESSDLRKPKSPEELDLSGDTDFLLRSSESLDLME